MKIKFLPLLFVLTTSLCLAHEHEQTSATDSDQINPPEVTLGKSKAYVLANGAYTMNCRGGQYGCSVQVSHERCQEGYVPSVATGMVNGSASGLGCTIKKIIIQPEIGSLFNSGDGYALSYMNAYINGGGSLGCSTSPVSINYTVYCT